jgi:uncharacterized protein YjiS (DUF1127 family)
MTTAAANSAAAIIASTAPSEMEKPELRSTSNESAFAVASSISPASRQREMSRPTLTLYEAIGHSSPAVKTGNPAAGNRRIVTEIRSHSRFCHSLATGVENDSYCNAQTHCCHAAYALQNRAESDYLSIIERARKNEIGAEMNLIRNFQNWRRYRNTVNELSRLSNHELSDLGISRGEIPFVARKSV